MNDIACGLSLVLGCFMKIVAPTASVSFYCYSFFCFFLNFALNLEIIIIIISSSKSSSSSSSSAVVAVMTLKVPTCSSCDFAMDQPYRPFKSQGSKPPLKHPELTHLAGFTSSSFFFFNVTFRKTSCRCSLT